MLLDAERDGTPVRKSSFAEVRQVGPFRALNTLLARQWAVLIADPLNLVFLLAQAAAIALLVAWVSSEVELRMFLGLIAVLWFGCSNGAQQIVSELPTFRRERVCGLGLNTYLFSKLAFVSATTLVQAGILFFVMLTSAVLIRPPIVDPSDLPHVVKKAYESAILDPKGEPLEPSYLGRLMRIQLWRAAFEAKEEVVGPYSGEREELEPVQAEPNLGTAKSSEPSKKPLPPISASARPWISLSALIFDLKQNIEDSLKPDKNPFAISKSATKTGIGWSQVLATSLILRFISIILAAVVGVALGLGVSALVRTPTQSVMWVPLMMIPQILLGGYVITLAEMPSSIRQLSAVVPSFAAERVNQVSLIFGQKIPRVTNESKIPNFIQTDAEKVSFEQDGKKKDTKYDQASPFNKAWQNLVVDADKVGQRPLEKGRGPSASKPKLVDKQPRIDIRFKYRDQVDDSGLRYSPRFDEINEAQTSMLILGLWILACYGIALGGIWAKRSS